MSDYDVAQQLQAWRSGDAAAVEQLTPVVYNELRRLVRNYLSGEQPEHTLAPTALVIEAYLRLPGQPPPDWRHNDHVVGVAAHLMRQILVEFARRRRSSVEAGFARAGNASGSADEVSLPSALPACVPPESDLVDLDSALQRLEETDAQKARAIELRYFAGLTVEETAMVLEVSVAAVHRELRMAEAWLCRELAPNRQKGLAASASA
jgi:RNA polymerase sigma factor (TIGR02999 family)